MVYYCTLLVGCGRVPEEIFQTESCEESTDDIEDVNEPLDDFVDDEIDCSEGPSDSRNYSAIIFFDNVLI